MKVERVKMKQKLRVPPVQLKTLQVGLRIVALTPVGTLALQKHERDRMKEPWAQRKVFDGLYQERVTAGPPMVVEILHKNERVAHLIPFESMVVPIKDAMLENGAILNIDYWFDRVGP